VVQSDLLDVDEAANLLHLKPATVRAWIYLRKITFVRLGRRVYLRRCDVAKLIEKNVVYPSRSSRIGGTV
jgi:excisionase family DNA binding protein